MSDTSTPRMDYAKESARLYSVTTQAEGCIYNEGCKLERELAEANAKMDETATNLVIALNRANSNGVQLDLIRDELKRIRARILESKFSNDPYLSNIVSYCTRSQEDIATTYSVIGERDKLEKQLTAHKAALEKCEKALSESLSVHGWPHAHIDEALSEIAKLKGSQ